MLKDHQKEQDGIKTEINAKRMHAERAVENLTSNTVKELNDGIAKAYLNQHRLDSEAKELQVNGTKLMKQAQQWISTCNNLNGAFKDLGDLTTWMNSIEKDVQFISKAIEDCYKPTSTEE